MDKDYVENYLQAISKPLPELDKTFDAELAFLIKNSKKDNTVLDAGCGAGRPADKFSSYVKKIIGIDNDKKMLDIAKQRCQKISNIEFQEKDALSTGFPNDFFDLTYGTYNLIGSLAKENRQKLIDEMARITKKGCKIINITWKDDKETTLFLKKYYPSIGIKILESDDNKTVTSKGVFERISRKELLEYYKNASLKNINFYSIGPVWLAITGTR